ncbi:MAG TPA: hypothetical protein VL242_50145 [Sorangium sp.]|uniref:hypothetical protein n=1 Tax=Sorangium sp. So ce1153 TaxID=3133333 RepID=UPI002CB4DE7C|nr:hypothetical protein [Sorangium sp.]
MKKLLWIGTVLLGALAPAQAAEPPSAAPAAPDGAAGGPRVEAAAALPDGGEGAAAAPKERLLEEAPPAPERTPRPQAAEWDAAETVRLARDRGGAACKARMRREWLRIDCATPSVAVVRTLGASAGEEWLWLDQKNSEHDPLGLATGVSVVFPVRHGDRRVIEILSATGGYRSEFGVATTFVISEQWLDGDAGPIVSLL